MTQRGPLTPTSPTTHGSPTTHDGLTAHGGLKQASAGMANVSGNIAAVAALIGEVRTGGDAAVRALTLRFDGVDVASTRIDGPALRAALHALDADDRRALAHAHRNIAAVAQAQRAAVAGFELEVEPGVFIGQRVMPIENVACYVPGGRHPLPSTVLMTVTPARIAGCGAVYVFTPPGPAGRPHPAILAAAALAGADAVFAIGGVQAIAAAAYGTDAVPACDLIVGPGNAWVTEAKRQVFGVVGIDSLAGPSEVLVLADDSAKAERVAADLIAQAEHDPDARARLFTTDATLPARVEQALTAQLADLATAAVARAALAASGPACVFADAEAMFAASDRAAAEHVHLHLGAPAVAVERLRVYGALFIGEDAAEVFGDYCAGGNHVLPTATSARYTGGLSAATFVRLVATQRVDGAGAAALAPVAARLARIEGLEGHARAAEQRGGGEPRP